MTRQPLVDVYDSRSRRLERDRGQRVAASVAEIQDRRDRYGVGLQAILQLQRRFSWSRQSSKGRKPLTAEPEARFSPLEYHCSLFRMRVKDLTPKQLLSVPCPTCGVPAGKRCERYSGVPRKEPHVERKLSAIEASEKK